jgi:hypothetical protein
VRLLRCPVRAQLLEQAGGGRGRPSLSRHHVEVLSSITVSFPTLRRGRVRGTAERVRSPRKRQGGPGTAATTVSRPRRHTAATRGLPARRPKRTTEGAAAWSPPV